MPLPKIVPNIIIVQPPYTDSGKLQKKLPIGGNNPAKIIAIAPVAIVYLFTTFVIAIKPTFWLNDVTGGHPNKAEIALANPSHANDPEISLSLIFLCKPEETMAVVSPIVSAADTKNITDTANIAPI